MVVLKSVASFPSDCIPKSTINGFSQTNKRWWGNGDLIVSTTLMENCKTLLEILTEQNEVNREVDMTEFFSEVSKYSFAKPGVERCH